MKVELAGYNIDRSLISKLNSMNATPETISAAYARISRSKKSVTELREESLLEVEKARKSNKNIIYDMGHGSIAEHAVFNFDLINVSRYIAEQIQRTRLASFTEKSQRYVTLKGDYYEPFEFSSDKQRELFSDVILMQNRFYQKAVKDATKYYIDCYSDMKAKECENRAKEDARYILALATLTQMGMTINARSLENLLRRLDRLELIEAKILSEKIKNSVKSTAPSLIKYVSAENNFNICDKDLSINNPSKNEEEVSLLDFTADGDEKILALCLFEKGRGDFHNILKFVKQLTLSKKKSFFQEIFKELKPWTKVPSVFEIAEATFQVSVSSSCFGQLKRHRLSSQYRTSYNPANGVVVPEIFEQLKLQEEFLEIIKKVDQAYEVFESSKPGTGAYILTNAHKISVIIKANLREWYHFTRLRSDSHSQWEIRDLSKKIEEKLKKTFPLAGFSLGGKEEFKKSLL